MAYKIIILIIIASFKGVLEVIFIFNEAMQLATASYVLKFVNVFISYEDGITILINLFRFIHLSLSTYIQI